MYTGITHEMNSAKVRELANARTRITLMEDVGPTAILDPEDTCEF